MSPTPDGVVLARDWLVGYFNVYPPVPPIVRYSHESARVDPALVQIAARTRAIDGRLDDGRPWHGR